MTDKAPREASRSTSQRARGVVTTISRSLRVPTVTWDEAKARAADEGVLMNRVILELLEGYARGIYKLPTTNVEITRTYPPQPGS